MFLRYFVCFSVNKTTAIHFCYNYLNTNNIEKLIAIDPNIAFCARLRKNEKLETLRSCKVRESVCQYVVVCVCNNNIVQGLL